MTKNGGRELVMQCAHAEFLRELALARGMRPYEIIGDRGAQIQIRDEPIRHLGSLDLPMEKIRFEFIDYKKEEVDSFMKNSELRMMRMGQ